MNRLDQHRIDQHRLDLVRTVAAADALGAPYELGLHPGRELPLDTFAPGGERPRVRILGGEADYGTWTDDTQIVLMVLDALRRSPEDPVPAYRENLLAWRNGAFTAQGQRLDVGNQTSHAISRIARGEQVEPSTSSGNACLMVAIAVHASGAGAEHLEALVRTTHNGDKAAADASVLFDILSAAGAGAPVPPVDPALFAQTPPSGFSEHTLIHARQRFHEAASFTEGIAAINAAGEDTDSIAAVFGALCAVAGGEAMAAPRGLLDELVGQELLERAARE